MSVSTEIVYRISTLDEITYLNDGWYDFAVANDAPGLTPERLLGRSLWDFISDPTTRVLYQEIVDRVHAGREVTFPFRCDAPAYRRQMEMTITKCPSGEVQFETRTISEDERARQDLLDTYVLRVGDMVRLCGWCKRADVGDGIWAEIEVAVESFSLFERPALPPLTHVMCEECFDMINGKIGVRRGNR